MGILAKDEEAASVADKLEELGGEPETHEVSEEALDQVDEAVESEPEEEEAG